jgi:hypothetical protein
MVSTGLKRGLRPAAEAHNSGATREKDGPPVGHSGNQEHTTGTGPELLGPAPTERAEDDQTDNDADGLRRSTARLLARAGPRPSGTVTRTS